jgi:tRNA 2-thiocytidine biosynthesis protein TtcA
MFRSLMNVRPSHMLDPGLFDFAGLVRPNPAAPVKAKDDSH